MIRFLFVSLIIVCVFSFFPLHTFAQIPFGGQIISVTPCIEGFWLIVGEPRGGGFISSHATRRYEHLVPYHQGQWLLGMASGGLACTWPCGPSICVIGAGALILFHGSSV